MYSLQEEEDAAPYPDLPSYNAIVAPLEPVSDAVRSSHRNSTAVHSSFLHRWDGLGLPSGYFLLRNIQNGRVLDLLGHKTGHGSEIGLHPPKAPEVDSQGSVQIQENNQVLFVDWDGHLTFASASRPVDCVDDSLKLSWPRPVMSFESQRSHALPRFVLDSATSTLQVSFESDPSYPGPDAPLDREDSWRDTEFLVEAVRKRKRTRGELGIWTTASSGLATASSGLASASKDLLTGLGTLSESAPGMISTIGDRLSGFNPFGRHSTVPPASKGSEAPPLPPKPLSPQLPQSPSDVPTPIASQPIASTSTLPPGTHPDSPLPALPEDDDEYDSDSSDSDAGGYRPVRVIQLPRSSWRDKFPSEALRASAQSQLGRDNVSRRELRKWRRRQWEVIPVIVRPAPLHTGPSSALDSHGVGLGLRYSHEQAQSRLAGGLQPTAPRNWSNTATSLASSAGGIVSHAGGIVVSSVSDALRTPLLSTVAAAGRRASNATGTTDGDDSNEALPRTPGSRGSWDDAMSLPDSDIERYLALTASSSRSGSRPGRSRSVSEGSERARLSAALSPKETASQSSGDRQFVSESTENRSEESLAVVSLPDLPQTPARGSFALPDRAEVAAEGMDPEENENEMYTPTTSPPLM